MTINTGINSVEIFDNGNTHSRLTVTVGNDVRIKIGKDVNPLEEDKVIHMLTEAANIIIDNGYNTSTLRGELKIKIKNEYVLTMWHGGKNKSKHSPHKIDLQLINMVGK